MGFRGFIDNARREASSMAQGAIPGLASIGQAITDDAYSLLYNKKPRANGRFSLDDVAKQGAREFARQSPILPLLRGDIKEAGSRFYERPITGTLDFLGAGSVANQGLRITSRVPGSIGVGSQRLRGYQQLDPSSLGDGLTIGQMPSQIKLADGTKVPGREYLLRPDIEQTANGLFARRTMRSPKATGNTLFDEGLNTGETLADDSLAVQATPRARYEPLARLGDQLNKINVPETGLSGVDAITAFTFGSRLGSQRFGKRLAIRNRSRLKVSSQEMMAEFGRNRKQYRKTWGKDSDYAVGRATFLASAGIKSSKDLDEAVARFQSPSGQKVVITDEGLDLQSSDAAKAVELNVPEMDITKKFIAHRDEMAEQLAKDIEAQQQRGYTVMHTGGSKPVQLTPEMVRGDKEAAYRLVGFGNLHLKRGVTTKTPAKTRAPVSDAIRTKIAERMRAMGAALAADVRAPESDNVPADAYSMSGSQTLFDTETPVKAPDAAQSVSEAPGAKFGPEQEDPNRYRQIKLFAQRDGVAGPDGDLMQVKHRGYGGANGQEYLPGLFRDKDGGPVDFISDNLAFPRVFGVPGKQATGLGRVAQWYAERWRTKVDEGEFTLEDIEDEADKAVEDKELDVEEARRTRDLVLNATLAEIVELRKSTEIDGKAPREPNYKHSDPTEEIRATDEEVEHFNRLRPIVKDAFVEMLDDYTIKQREVRLKTEAEDDMFFPEVQAQDAAGLIKGAMLMIGELDPTFAAAGKKIGSAAQRNYIKSIIVDSMPEIKRHEVDVMFDDMTEAELDAWIDEYGVEVEGPEWADPEMRGGNDDPPSDADTTDGDAPDDDSQRDLRRRTAENYSKANWYRGYLENLVKSRVDESQSDITQLFAELKDDAQVRAILDSDEFRDQVLPSHQTLIAAQLEADRVRLGANALSHQAITRNNERLAMLTGKEGEGMFFVARRPRTKPVDSADRTEGPESLTISDDEAPGDPTELISKGQLDLNPTVHLSNYLRRKQEASKQELVDTVSDSAVLVTPQEAQTRIKDKVAVTEEDFLRAGTKKRGFVIIRPNGELYRRIEESQPLASQAARRLAEDGYHTEASNIKQATTDWVEASKEGDFSLGDMIRNPNLRGEPDDSRYMVPTEMYEAILNEVTDSTTALSSFLQATSTGFKISVLHGRWPGWVVNNTVGSQLYLAMTGGLGATIPHAGAGKMVEEFFPDVLGSGSREMATGAEDLGRKAESIIGRARDSKPGQAFSRSVNTLSDLNQKIADEPARVERIEQVIEDRFQQTITLAKARGMEIPDTLESRRRLLMDQQVREDIATEVLDDMIDFTNMSKQERMWWSNVFPFWTFIKGSTKSTTRLMADHPGRTWLPGQVASYGAERTDEEYENGIPEYLRNLTPVGEGSAMSVGGMNPWGQQSSMLGGVLGALNAERPTGQEHPASMVNPALIAPLEAITNRDIYTDYPLKGNLLQNLGMSTLESIPLLETAMNIVKPGEYTGKSVFIPSRKNTLLNTAGIPIRDLNEGNLAVRMAADENRRRPGGSLDYWRFHNGV